METVAHPRLRPGVLEDRRYQAAIAESAATSNTLAVIPTGLGKTAIALRLIAEDLRRYPTKSVLFLAPTRPLVVQHAESVRSSILGPAPVVLTGAVGPGARAELLSPPQVVVATPQVIGNDLAKGGSRSKRSRSSSSTRPTAPAGLPVRRDRPCERRGAGGPGLRDDRLPGVPLE